MSNKKQPTKVTGTVEQHAKYIFDRFIIPAHAQIENIDESSADEFAFYIATKAVAEYLGSANDLDSAKELLLSNIECICKDIQNEKKGLGILATPMGKPA